MLLILIGRGVSQLGKPGKLQATETDDTLFPRRASIQFIFMIYLDEIQLPVCVIATGAVIGHGRTGRSPRYTQEG